MKRWEIRVQREENEGKTQKAGIERARQQGVTDEVVVIFDTFFIDRVVLAT